MNYEQKYNEALDAAKHIYDDMKSGGNFGGMEDLEVIFPELADSEDEKIRKWLVDYFTKIGENWIHREFTCKQIVAYLEKQKEHKPVDDKAFEEWIDGWYNEHHRDGYITMDEREFKNFFRGIRNMYQQKPAEWSEEDELMRKRCIADLGYLTEYEPQYKERYDAQINWLKSLRPQPQMLEDWTSEDDELLADVLGCITLVQTYKAYGDFKEFKMWHTGEELRSFVRSLKSRPRKQPSWKPSEEQMEAPKGVPPIESIQK